MTNSVGKSSLEGAFLPLLGSNPQDILEKITGKSGWSDLEAQTTAAKEIAEIRESAANDLKRSYAWLYAQPQGKIIIDDLIDQTLRRGCSHPNPDAGIEQEALYGRERKGQNSFALYCLRMIHDGQNIPAPGRVGKKRSSKK